MPLSVRLNWTSRDAACARLPRPSSGWCVSGTWGGASMFRYPSAVRRCTRSSSSWASFACASSSPSPRSACEHLGGELAALDQRVEDCFLERVERSVGVAAEVAPVRVRHASAGESGL